MGVLHRAPRRRPTARLAAHSARDRTVRLADGTRLRFRTRASRDREGRSRVRVGLAVGDGPRAWLSEASATWVAHRLLVLSLVAAGPGYGPDGAAGMLAHALRQVVGDRCPDALADVRRNLA